VSVALAVGRNISPTFANRRGRSGAGGPSEGGRIHWLFFGSESESAREVRRSLAGFSGFESLPPSQHLARVQRETYSRTVTSADFPRRERGQARPLRIASAVNL